MFTKEQQDQLRLLHAWQAASLAAGQAEPRAGSGPPPEFEGDWSGATFAGADADLRCADFRKAGPMASAVLAGADLRGARLDGVDLRGADFAGARMDGVVLREADLRDARMADAVGISVEHLAGADLRSAGLPADVREFAQLDGVSEVSKYIQSIYRLLLALCGFAALTVMSVRDESTVLNDGQSVTQLPILQASVSPQVFSYVMPGLILLLYAYQVLYTVSLWRLLSFLPAYFPDGEPLDRRAYPSMVNIFVRYSLRRIANARNDDVSFVLHWLITFALPPLTLGVIWLAGLKKHDRLLSLSQALMVGLAAFLAVSMLTLSGSMIRDEWKIKDVSLGRFLRERPKSLALVAGVAIVAAAWSLVPALTEWVPDVLTLALVVAVVVMGSVDVAARVDDRRRKYAEATSSLLLNCLSLSLALYCASLSCFAGTNYDLKAIGYSPPGGAALEAKAIPEAGRRHFPERRAWSPALHLLAGSRFNPFLDFRNKVISQRPSAWKGQGGAEDDQITLVVGADLEGADLRSMDAERAFLARANLRHADLRGAYLRFAYLREADLSKARLRGAYLRGANLRDANLRGVDLDGVILSEDLDDPTRRIGPNFQGARLDYRDKTLTPMIVEALSRQGVCNLPLAYFGVDDAKAWDDPANGALLALRKLGMPPLTDKQLIAQQFDKKTTFPPGLLMTGADLSGFVLPECVFDGVDLRGASFVGADLARASFVGANLGGADFTNAYISDAKFDGANIAGAVFVGSTWRKVSSFSAEQQDLLGAAEGHPTKGK